MCPVRNAPSRKRRENLADKGAPIEFAKNEINRTAGEGMIFNL